MENSKLNSLLNLDIVSLADIIAEPTTQRSESNLAEDFNEITNKTDFEPEPIIEQVEPPEPQIDKKQVEAKPYDPEKNASAMVYGLQAIESIILTPLAIYKHRKTSGGKEVISAMRSAFDRTNLGEELDEKEQRLSDAYQQYKNEIKELSNDLSWSDEKTKNLIKMAIPYCEDKKFEMNSGTAFWMMYGADLAGKITKIIL
jgi:hypothetical protein